jgi:hypothetical protein
LSFLVKVATDHSDAFVTPETIVTEHINGGRDSDSPKESGLQVKSLLINQFWQIIRNFAK